MLFRLIMRDPKRKQRGIVGKRNLTVGIKHSVCAREGRRVDVTQSKGAASGATVKKDGETGTKVYVE